MQEGIPKIIHTIAPSNKLNWHPIWQKCYDSWFKNFDSREFKFVMWSDEACEKLVRESYPEFLDLYLSFPHKIMRFDIVRLLILHKYGGIYHDMDYFCYKNFYNILVKNKSQLYIVSSEDYMLGQYLENSLIASVKNNNFFTEAVKLASSLFSFTKSSVRTSDVSNPAILFVTGPLLLQNTLGIVFDNYKYQNLATNNYGWFNSEKIKFFLREIFNPKLRTFNDEIYTKHFSTSVWIEENYNVKLKMEKLEIDINDFDFFKDYNGY